MSDSDLQTVWVFHGSDADHASGVFTSRERAEAWIQSNKLSGTLTKYPVDGRSTPASSRRSATISGRPGFTSATQEHCHYDGGLHGNDVDADSDD